MTILKTYLVLAVLVVAINANATEKDSIRVLNWNQFEPLLNHQSDTVYVINFWATWCAPCVREIPVFEELNQKYSDEKIKIILVSLDFPNQLESRLKPFVDRLEMRNEVILLDAPRANTWIPLVSESWTGAIPATLIYNQGFRQFYQKEFHFEELNEILSSLLN